MDTENLMFDDLGVRVPPLCDNCKGCQYCNAQRSELSREDQEVLKLVQGGMSIDAEKGEIKAKYPMNSNYDLLEDNRLQLVARQTSVEKSLKAGQS